MVRKKVQIGGIILAGIIIISTFVYAIELQPIASGDLNSNIYKFLDTSTYSKHYYRFLELFTSRFLLPWNLINGGKNTYKLKIK